MSEEYYTGTIPTLTRHWSSRKPVTMIVDEIFADRITLVRKNMPTIKQIIINPPATIIIWKDGTKTVCKSNEEYDPEVGVAMCITKKYFGSRNQFTKAVKGAMKDFEKRTWK